MNPVLRHIARVTAATFLVAAAAALAAGANILATGCFLDCTRPLPILGALAAASAGLLAASAAHTLRGARRGRLKQIAADAATLTGLAALAFLATQNLSGYEAALPEDHRLLLQTAAAGAALAAGFVASVPSTLRFWLHARKS